MDREVVENVKLCEEQGWIGTFYLTNGEVLSRVSVKSADWKAQAVCVEGESLGNDSRVVYLSNVSRVEVGWN